jgi:hypothetical protein
VLDRVGDDGVHERLREGSVGRLRRPGLGTKPGLAVAAVAVAELVEPGLGDAGVPTGLAGRALAAGHPVQDSLAEPCQDYRQEPRANSSVESDLNGLEFDPGSFFSMQAGRVSAPNAGTTL